ncbi:cytochrome P450 [Whalleya microplaca]|nr:cytochrome P450 [Whalleya microplaca]
MAVPQTPHIIFICMTVPFKCEEKIPKVIMILSSISAVTATAVAITFVVIATSLIITRVVYNYYFHPLAGFPGPWYAAVTSLILAIISVRRAEPDWLIGLTKKYGNDKPIRIAPGLLLFPKANALKDIYWDPECNLKAELYGTGALGPPSMFTTLEGDHHRRMRKALGGSQWTIGSLKNTWEPRLDELITLFIEKLSGFAEARQDIVLGDKLPQFAADVLTMLAFTEPWGFIRNSRDERNFLKSWREGLGYLAFAGRWKAYRDYVLKNPMVAPYFLPRPSDTFGMGYLASFADEQVTKREKDMKESKGSWHMDNPDLLQYCLDARYSDGISLSDAEKRAHITLLIQAGADTTGTALGCTLRFFLMHHAVLQRARAEIKAADQAGKLSRPIAYEESRKQLPYFSACIKESLRLNPPAANLFARVIPAAGKRIAGVFVPGAAEVTTNAYVVQRDPELSGPDPEAFRPERWLEAGRGSLMDAAIFTFGMGPRVCIGKDVAYMELWKLLPEIIRNFDIELLDPGRFVVVGGVAFNEGLHVLLTSKSL